MTDIDISKLDSVVQKKRSRNTLDTSEIGSSGLRIFSGRIYEEYLPQLQGDSGIRIFTEMRDDPVIGSILFAIDMLIRQVSWHTEPFSGKREDVKAAAFLQECLDDMSLTWNEAVTDALTFLPYGWSFQEIVYKRRDGWKGEGGESSKYNDGKIGWRKFASRPQETLYKWVTDTGTGAIKAMQQLTLPDYQLVTIPISKGLLFRTTANKNSPQGRSVLRSAYRPWYFKKRIEEIEAIGIERDLAGMPMAWVDPRLLSSDASPDDIALLNSIKQLVVNVRRDQQEGVIFPLAYDMNGNQMYKFELMSAGGSRQFDIGGVIERYSRQIAMTVMADFIFLGHQGIGSYALSSDKTTMFAKAIGTWIDIIQDTYNRFAVPRLFRVNGMPTDRLPRIVHGDIESPDLASLGAYITQLAGVGVSLFPDEKVEAFLRQAGGIPQKSEQANELSEQRNKMQLEQLELQHRQLIAQTDMTERQAEASQFTPEQTDIQLKQQRLQLAMMASQMGQQMSEPQPPDQSMGEEQPPPEEEQPPMQKRLRKRAGGVPPSAARREAEQGLAWRREFNRGGTEIGVARARDIMNGRELSEDTIKRMVSYFARHEVDKQGRGWSEGSDGFPSAGRIAWALWGGDAGRQWAESMAKVQKMGDERARRRRKRIESAMGPEDEDAEG